MSKNKFAELITKYNLKQSDIAIVRDYYLHLFLEGPWKSDKDLWNKIELRCLEISKNTENNRKNT